MIKFFRKIRQKLLIEKKFRNYLVYAIGEMILVVIGILIALSINNWNNDNQKREREIFYLGGIKNNLIANLNNQILPAIEELEKTTESHKKLESYFFHSSDKINQDSVRWLIYDVNVGWNLILNTVAFENLNSIGVELISNDTLRNQITNLYGYEFTNLANQQSITQKYFADRVQPVFNSVIGLWSREEKKTEAEIESIRKNKFYASILRSQTWMRANKLYVLKLTKPNIVQLIQNIEKEINRLNH